jgi:hypothetical protein
MKNKHLLLFCCIVWSVASFGQGQKEKMTREEKNEKNQARQERIDLKNDMVIFKKQILGLKEYALERKKIPDLQKTSKMAVKVTAVIDSESTENSAESKTLIGYIKQDVGDNTTNMYELTYDRAQKKITSVKRTPEAIDADRELAEEKEEKASARSEKTSIKKSTAGKKPVTKKDEDEDDEDADEEKPSKSKRKDKEEDDE